MAGTPRTTGGGSNTPRSARKASTSASTPQSALRRSATQAAGSFERALLVSLTRLGDRDTQQHATRELNELLENSVVDDIPLIVARLNERDALHPAYARRMIVKMYGILASVHQDAIQPQLQSIIKNILRRLTDKDTAVRQQCAESMALLARHVSEPGTQEQPQSLAVFLKPLFTTLADQNKLVQGGAAGCLAQVLHAAGMNMTEPYTTRLCTRLCKYLSTPGFLAKTDILQSIGNFIEVQADRLGLDNVHVLCMSVMECVTSEDWTVRRVAVEVLQTFGLCLGEVLEGRKEEILALLEKHRFDKIPPVREVVADAMQIFSHLESQPHSPAHLPVMTLDGPTKGATYTPRERATSSSEPDPLAATAPAIMGASMNTPSPDRDTSRAEPQQMATPSAGGGGGSSRRGASGNTSGNGGGASSTTTPSSSRRPPTAGKQRVSVLKSRNPKFFQNASDDITANTVRAVSARSNLRPSTAPGAEPRIIRAGHEDGETIEIQKGSPARESDAGTEDASPEKRQPAARRESVQSDYDEHFESEDAVALHDDNDDVDDVTDQVVTEVSDAPAVPPSPTLTDDGSPPVRGDESEFPVHKISPQSSDASKVSPRGILKNKNDPSIVSKSPPVHEARANATTTSALVPERRGPPSDDRAVKDERNPNWGDVLADDLEHTQSPTQPVTGLAAISQRDSADILGMLRKISLQQARMMSVMEDFRHSTQASLRSLESRLNSVERLVTHPIGAASAAVNGGLPLSPNNGRKGTPTPLNTSGSAAARMGLTLSQRAPSSPVRLPTTPASPLDDESGLWSATLAHLANGEYEEAYDSVVRSGDQLQLVRLMSRTGAVLDKLSPHTANQIFSLFVEFFHAGNFIYNMFPWIQQLSDVDHVLPLATRDALASHLSQLAQANNHQGIQAGKLHASLLDSQHK